MSVTQTRCEVCHNARGRDEVIYSVDSPVKGYANLVQSLIAATEFENMYGVNAVECPVCDAKVSIRGR
jgi:hypothetical protein